MKVLSFEEFKRQKTNGSPSPAQAKGPALSAAAGKALGYAARIAARAAAEGLRRTTQAGGGQPTAGDSALNRQAEQIRQTFEAERDKKRGTSLAEEAEKIRQQYEAGRNQSAGLAESAGRILGAGLMSFEDFLKTKMAGPELPQRPSDLEQESFYDEARAYSAARNAGAAGEKTDELEAYRQQLGDDGVLGPDWLREQERLEAWRKGAEQNRAGYLDEQQALLDAAKARERADAANLEQESYYDEARRYAAEKGAEEAAAANAEQESFYDEARAYSAGRAAGTKPPSDIEQETFYDEARRYAAGKSAEAEKPQEGEKHGPDAHSASSRSAEPVREDESGFRTTDERDALLRELDQISQNEGYITNEADANAAAAREKEIIARVVEIDQELGNPARYYDEAGRLGGIVRGWANEQAAGYSNALGTIAALAGDQDEAGRAIADSSIAGYVTDPVAEAIARQDAEQGKLDSLGVLDTNQQITDATQGFADEARARSAEELAKARAGLSGFESLMVDVAKGALDLGADAIINLLVPGGGTAAMGTRVFGLAAADQRDKGGSVGQQLLSGLKAMAIEIFTEKIGGPFEKVYGKTFTGRIVNEAMDKLGSSPIGRRLLSLADGFVSEGLEEVLSNVLNTEADKIFQLDPNAKVDWSEALYEGVIGGLLGMAGGGFRGLSTAQQNAAVEQIVEAAVNAQEAAAEAREAEGEERSFADAQDDSLDVQDATEAQTDTEEQAEEQTEPQQAAQEARPLPEEQQKAKPSETEPEEDRREGMRKREGEYNADSFRKTREENAQAIEERAEETEAALEEQGVELDEDFGQTSGESMPVVDERAYSAPKQALETVQLLDGSETRVTGMEYDPESGELLLRVEDNQTESGGRFVNRPYEGNERAAGGVGPYEGTAAGTQTNTGRLVPLSAADLSEEQSQVVETLRSVLGPEQAAHAFNIMDAGQDAGSFARAYGLVRNIFGRNGANMERAMQSNLAEGLSPEQFQHAYLAGQQMAEQMRARGEGRSFADAQDDRGTQANMENGLPRPSADGLAMTEESGTRGGSTTATGRQAGTVSFAGAVVDGVRLAPVTENIDRADIRAAETFAREAGVNLVFYQSEADANGSYSGSHGIYRDGTVYLDIHAGMNSESDSVSRRTLLFTLSHELTHMIQENAPAQYEELRRFVTGWLAEHEGESFQRMVEAQMAANENMHYDEAVDEVVANACERVLVNSEAVEEMARTRPTLFETLREYIRRFLRRMQARHEEAKAMEPVLQELSLIWDKGFAAAVENRQSGQNKSAAREGSAVKFSAREEVRKMDIPWDTDNRSSIKTQISRVLDKLSARKPVTSVEYNRSKENYRQKLDEILRTRFGYKINRQDGISFLFDKNAIATIGHYVGSDAEAAAAIAAPYVLKRGEIISGHKYHNGGLYPSLTFAAPVDLNGEKGIEAVTVLFADKDRVHSLRIVAPDGSEFVLPVIEEATPEMEGVGINAPLTRPTGVASENSILDPSEKSNTRNSSRDLSRTDRELLLEAAVQKGAGKEVRDYARAVRAEERLEEKRERQEQELGELRKKSAKLPPLEEAMEQARNAEQALLDAQEGLRAAKRTFTPERAEDAMRGEKYARALESGLERAQAKLQKADDAARAAWDKYTKARDAAKELTKAEQELRKTEKAISEALDRIEEMEAGKALREAADAARERFWNKDVAEAVRSNRELREANRRLQRELDTLREQARIVDPEARRVRREDVRRLAGALLEEHESGLERGWLEEQLQKMGDYLVSGNQGKGLNAGELNRMAARVAEQLLNNVYTENNENERTWRELKERVRGTRLIISEELRGDIADFESWRRRHMGTFTLVKDKGAGNAAAGNRAIDSFYQELAEQYGLPQSVTAQSDMLSEIERRIESLAPRSEKTYSRAEIEEMLPYVRDEILDAVMGRDLRQADTQMERSVKAAVQKAQEETRKAQRQLREERATRDEQVRRKIEQLKARQEESRQIKTAKDKIRRMQRKLTRELTENSAKHHIPDAMKADIGSFLTTLDTLGPFADEAAVQSYLDQMDEVRQIVAQQSRYLQEGAEDGDGQILDLPPELAEALQNHINQVRKASKGDKRWKISQMNLAQVKQLEEILTVLCTSVQNANILLTEPGRFKATSEAAEQTIRDMGQIRERSSSWSLADSFRRLIVWNNTTPFYAFKRMGEGGMAMFKSLTKGWGELARKAQGIIEFAEKAYTAEEAKAWEESTHEFELRRRLQDIGEGEAETESVTLTEAQIMELWCLWQREQARGHLLGAGIKVNEIRKSGKTVRRANNYLLSFEDVSAMLAVLSDRQKEVCRTLQQYMNTTGSDWGNEVSMKRYGIRSFTEEHYWPIRTDSNSRDARTADSDRGNLYRLLNQSFTKSTVRNANNAVVLGSALDSFANHMADMAKYNALALPMLDSMRWFNYRTQTGSNEQGQFTTASVRQALEQAWGKDAGQYFQTLMQDLNGNEEAGRGEDQLRRLASNYKVASVGANLRVALQQPTSIVRASLVIEPKYLAKGAFSKRGVEKALKYSGLAIWKALGYYDTNINRGLREKIKHTEGFADKLREKSMILAEQADHMTWGALWNACELETKEKTGLSGEALMEATAERFDEVIMATQVMDSTLTRSQNMRSKSGLLSEFTAFMAEPTLTLNTMMDVGMQFDMEARRSDAKTAAKKLAPLAARAAIVYVSTNAATALFAAVGDALRDDDDYETWLQKLMQHFLENFKDNLDPTQNIPFVKDAVNILLRGDTKDMMAISTLQKLRQVYEIWDETARLASGELERATEITYYGRMTTFGKIYKTLDAAGRLIGQPIAPAAREVQSFWNASAGLLWPELKLRTYDAGPEREIRYAFQDGFLSEADAVAQLLEKGLAEDESEAVKKVYKWGLGGDAVYKAVKDAALKNDSAAYADALAALTEAGYAEKEAQSQVRGAIKDRYQGSDTSGTKLSKSEAVRCLEQYGGKSREDAEKLVEEWTCFIVTGIAYDKIGDKLLSGTISQNRAAELWESYGGMDREAAKSKAAATVFKGKHPDMNADNRGGISQAEAAAALDSAIRSGEITRAQAEVIWAGIGSNWKKSYSEYTGGK